MDSLGQVVPSSNISRSHEHVRWVRKVKHWASQGCFKHAALEKNKKEREKGVIAKLTYISFVDDNIECIITDRHGSASFLYIAK